MDGKIEDHYLTEVPADRKEDDWKAIPEAVVWYQKRKKEALAAWKSGEKCRTKQLRRRLLGYSTVNTWPFYKSLPYTPFTLHRHIDEVSRERYALTPKETPKKYWEMWKSPPKQTFDGIWNGPKPKVFRRLWSKEPTSAVTHSAIAAVEEDEIFSFEGKCQSQTQTGAIEINKSTKSDGSGEKIGFFAGNCLAKRMLKDTNIKTDGYSGFCGGSEEQ